MTNMEKVIKEASARSKSARLCGECGVMLKHEGANYCAGCLIERGDLVAVMPEDVKRLRELERFIQDARAFIEWAFTHNSEALIRSTLVHDIAGLADRAQCFSPRVSGYAKLSSVPAEKKRS